VANFLCFLIIFILAGSIRVLPTEVIASTGVVLIDPDLQSHLAAGNRTRVLVGLHMDEAHTDQAREEAIARAQDAVLARLPLQHSLLVRRYTSVPLLVLEIDETALRALQGMSDLVTTIKIDSLLRPQ
jgi:hypothetical protein